MSRILKTFLCGGLAALALSLVATIPASADDAEPGRDGVQQADYRGQGDVEPVTFRRPWRRGGYWGRYWDWYDRDYRPRVHRDYYRNYRDGFGYYRYPHRYGDRYRYHPRAGLRFGPLQFRYWH